MLAHLCPRMRPVVNLAQTGDIYADRDGEARPAATVPFLHSECQHCVVPIVFGGHVRPNSAAVRIGEARQMAGKGGGEALMPDKLRAWNDMQAHELRAEGRVLRDHAARQ